MTVKPVGLAIAVLFCLAVPARAETSSTACIAAIKAANIHHRADAVPDDCWRIGPLRLGMRAAAVRLLLGPPDARAALATVYHRRRFALVRMLYVYPRNLGNRLRLTPQHDIHPATLQLMFWKDMLVAITASRAAATQSPPCTPSRAGPVFALQDRGLPYSFHGIGLGVTPDLVQQYFGRFASVGAAGDFRNYWPVPIAIGGRDSVGALEIASGMAFVNKGAAPLFQLRRDPRSCLVTGYTVSAGK